MTFISILEGAFAWLNQKGTYKQAQLYQRGDAIYAKHGSGYIRLRANSATSNPNVRWLELDGGEEFSILDQDMRDPLLVRKVALAA